MEFEDFAESVASGVAPDGANAALLALWWDAKGEWGRAHELAQAAGNRDGDWVHAYLHRKEGDDGNARYWYARCGKPFFDGSLEDEWRQLVESLLR